MGTNQDVIDTLTDIKNAICGITEAPTSDGLVQIVGTTTGELSQQQKDDCAPHISTADGKIADLISTSEHPKYNPPTAGFSYTPKTWTGDTDTLIAGACHEACEALDEYVACNDDTSGQHLRHTRDALEAFKTSGGL